MLGLMQTQPLLVSSIIRHAARHHGGADIVSRNEDGSTDRTTYPQVEHRARRLARALEGLGIQQGDRVATLAWNSARHLESYYAISGMGAVCHTINPRLLPDDILYIMQHAEDRVLLSDPGFAPLVAQLAPGLTDTLRAVVFLGDQVPDVALPAGIQALAYESLLDGADESFAWPLLNEGQASALCYTSGTTGRPKGVLYSHRSTVLHAYASSLPDAFGLRAADRVMPVVPMFHVNAWGMPYSAPLVGASLVMPGRHLDGASLHTLMNTERVTFSAGVPTVWFGVLNHLRASGGRLETLQRLACGGSTCPPALIDAFGDEYGVRVDHAWGMSELSPLGTCYAPSPGAANLPPEQAARVHYRQGRALPGVDMRIVDGEGRELPWDGESFGDLEVRGPWVCQRYFGDDADATGPDGWFATGDVATIDAAGFMEITDRSKDIVKSGGEWISSIALENIAMSHPAVAEAAVVAMRHPKWDERPLLIVVPKGGQSVSEAELLPLFEGRVAKWWTPDAVAVIDDMPHTATGKINKLALRARFRNGIAPLAPHARSV